MNCEVCHRPLGVNLVYNQYLDIFACPSCASLLYTCYTCRYGNACDFETNPSTLPKQVQVSRQQGNMVMSQVIRNPERVKTTCENGCPCWSNEIGCGKQFCNDNRFCYCGAWVYKNEKEHVI